MARRDEAPAANLGQASPENQPVGGQTEQATASPAPVASPSPVAAAQPPKTSWVTTLKDVGFSPGAMLMWGLIIAGACYVIGKALPEEAEEAAGGGRGTAEGREENTGAEGDIRRGPSARSKGAPVSETEGSELARQAIEWLRQIRFQQSFTSGWAGSLKLPVGLEGGINSAVTLAQNQLSLPEIADNLAHFLDLVSQEYQVIIGIDELDKLESEVAAQQFLNQIKSVFGLENCFYLMSVSENAMSSFERRGLPFRDVFDSSFDNIIYVDYLDLKGARSLLEKRVIGKPVPFLCLCYCLSGGLARDTIRSFRNLLELRQRGPGKNDLSTLCQSIIRDDLKAKLRAVGVSAKKIGLEPEVGLFLEKLHGLDRVVSAAAGLLPSALLSEIRDLYCDGETPPPPPLGGATDAASEEKAGKRNELKTLGNELAIYVYYCLTLLGFFSNDLTEQVLTEAEIEGRLDNLARARQLLTVNVNISKTLLDEFRVRQNMEML